MKKYILILFMFMLAFSLKGFSQNSDAERRQKWEKIEGLRLEYVSSKLSLNSANQEKFSSIYSAYQKEYSQIMAERRRAREANKERPEKKVEIDFLYESKILELKKNYKNKFQTVLNADQLTRLYDAEREFREQLINQLKKK